MVVLITLDSIAYGENMFYNMFLLFMHNANQSVQK